MNIRKIAFLAAVMVLVSAVSLAQPQAGQQAPEIALPNPKGEMQKLSDYAGKIVLVDFWASWCGPCRKANPNLVRLYAKYRKKGFEIFGVSIDDEKSSWKKAILSDRMTWTQVNENQGWDGPVAAKWKIEQIPTSYLLDKTGKIVAVDPDSKQLEQSIVALLNN